MAIRIDRTRLFDKRVVQRNIRAGRVTKDEYRAWLKDLADTGDKIMARDEGGDDDGYEPAPRPAAAVAPVVQAPAAPVAAPVVPPVAPPVAQAPSAPAAPVAAAPEPPEQAG